MRANLVVIGSHGDVLPFIALGSRLRARGFDVTLATAEPFRSLVEKQDLQFHSLATEAEWNRLISSRGLWTPIRGARLMMRTSMHLLRPTYDFVTANYVSGSTVTVASTMALGARIAHEHRRIPLATVHLAPLYIRSRFAPPRMPGLPAFVSRFPAPIQHELMFGVDRFSLDPLCRPLKAFRSELGLPPLKGVLRWWLHSPDRTIAMFPAWFAPPQPDWPSQIRQVAFPKADLFGNAESLSPDLRRFLNAGLKPLALTFGSAMMSDGAYVRSAIELCRRSGRRAVIISPVRHDVPRHLETAIFQTRYAPFSQLFQECEAVIHHGGVGTVASALSAGLPQLVVPIAFDHFDEAKRVERLGVGTSIHQRRFRCGAGQTALAELLSSTLVRQRCAAWAAAMRDADGTIEACDAIEQLARIRR